jgi:hypothetical protein
VWGLPWIPSTFAAVKRPETWIESQQFAALGAVVGSSKFAALRAVRSKFAAVKRPETWIESPASYSAADPP